MTEKFHLVITDYEKLCSGDGYAIISSNDLDNVIEKYLAHVKDKGLNIPNTLMSTVEDFKNALLTLKEFKVYRKGVFVEKITLRINEVI